MECSFCAQLIDVIQTAAMREQLAKVYALMFRFYRDAIAWYLSSTRSKFFGSLNDRIKARFEEAAKEIQETIDRMFTRNLAIGTAAMIKVTSRTAASSQAEILRQRQNPQIQTFANIDSGEMMHALLQAMHRFQHSQDTEIGGTVVQPECRAIEEVVQAEIENVPEPRSTITRADLLLVASQLEQYIVGDEGHSLFGTGHFWTPDLNVIPILQDWSAKDAAQKTLWVSGPVASDIMSSAQAAAMNVLLTAWKVAIPVISHFCEKPRHGAEAITSEQSGMIGLVYSLIFQLLQFSVESDTLDLNGDDISCLDGTSSSFSGALVTLYELLKSTPHVRYCVIHNLNALEWGGGSEWCHDFLDILFRAQADSQGSTLR